MGRRARGVHADQLLEGGLNITRSFLYELGARCVWLMPVAESRSYHGYDVTNYYRVEGYLFELSRARR
jgi:hypothetical protein